MANSVLDGRAAYRFVDSQATEASRMPAQVLPGKTLWADLVQVGRNLVARRRQRKLIVALSRHHSRLLVDMGFDPEAIAAAVENSWDELEPGALIRHEPWRQR